MLTLQRGASHRDRQIDALVTEVHDLTVSNAQDSRIAAQRHREDVLRQAGTQTKLDASLAAEDALLAYLRAHGIHLPARLVTVIRPPRIVVRHPRATHHTRRRQRSATSSTTPTGPGKSGHAPGHHHKHPRHSRRHH
jgi:hypothetical protein